MAHTRQSVPNCGLSFQAVFFKMKVLSLRSDADQHSEDCAFSASASANLGGGTNLDVGPTCRCRADSAQHDHIVAFS